MKKFVTIGKSKQFYDFLKNEIITGEYKPGDKFPSIRDLAAKYSISTITVNSVISNLVNEGLLYVEQGIGTFVSDKKSTLINKKKMIGVMFFDFSAESNVETGMFNSIQRTLKEDYFVIPFNSYDSLDLFYKGIKGFTELGVDGMILVPPTTEDYNPETVKRLMKSGTPVVFINRNIPIQHADFLSMDFTSATYKAVKYLLLKKNRRNIILIKSNSETLSDRMFKGYINAHEDTGFQWSDDLFIEWHKNMDVAEVRMRKLLERADGLVGSDIIIYRLRKTIYESCPNIPDDLSIIGLNDTVYSRFMNPSLTAVPYPSDRIGKVAALAIMDRIEKGRREDWVRYFDSDMIIRGSS